MGSYTANLRKRLSGASSVGKPLSSRQRNHRKSTPTAAPSDERGVTLLEQALFEDGEPIIQVVPPHPSKYPNHKGTKGSVWNGICNVTRCQNLRAKFFNISTRGYYCRTCAEGIDYNPRKPRLCVMVGHDLTHEEMNELYDRKDWL